MPPVMPTDGFDLEHGVRQEALERAVARVGHGWHGIAALVELAAASAWPAERAAHEAAPDDPGAAPGDPALSRRSFLQLAGSGAAAVGLAACSSRPSREILPYASQPPELTPGVPLHYATALVEDGFATGVLVASHEGRPTKVEGNPDHPASLGATRAIEQAAVLQLFDPERARLITERGAPAPWAAIEAVLDAARAARGDGLHLVLEPTTSPIAIELIRRVRAALPAAGVTFWSPFSPRASLAGNRLAFGRPLQTQLELRAADVIVALDADLVAEHPMALAYARQISDRRRVVDGGSAMSRLYAIEAGYTATGVIADHRFSVRGSQIERVAGELLAAVLGRLGLAGPPPALTARLASVAPAAERAPWIVAIAAELTGAPGRSVVVAGERQPLVVHAIAAAINAALGNLGRTVGYTEPVAFEAGQPSHDLAGVVRAIDRGAVTRLLVLGGNPVYTAPQGVALAGAIGRVADSVYLGLYDHETARACRYAVPGLHELEQWGAARAYDGTLTPIQPLIEPLFGGRSVADVLHRLLDDPPADARDRLAAAWSRLVPDAPLEAALGLGAVPGTAAPHVAVELAWGALAPVISAAGARSPAPLELAIRPHPFVHDGRYTNNPWLLELPEPITKLTWDCAAQLSPATAARLGVADGDLLALTVAGPGAAGGDTVVAAALAPTATIELPAIIVPGHADDAITVHAGFGRDGGEHTARGIGASAFRLWRSALEFHPAITAVARGDRRPLAITQAELSDEDRPLALTGTLAGLAGPAVRDALAHHRGAQPSLYARRPHAPGAQWAMSIDLTTCTGCSACVMACAAENNTPVVGARQVRNGREMHWLRIDRYYRGPADAPVLAVQPMACQHCELAPCEYVCPVEATTHSPDGLNEMTYNRCIGTRFCSNNCPYKVRRFNWFDFKDHRGLRIAARNPDVTVRDRGVMEKCTYCVQRIRRAEIDARVADRPLAGSDVRTACQQVCPTQAIAFGSLTEVDSPVVEHRRRPHSYAVLHDQGTAPRTQYLARIRNPNGALP
ncbi:MAG TPA: 4Fe-4S dicluster domain-containing protein [Kofleriaceae bacterium]|nr:4Fe-4S dicluster domain-containing protein [Kofleriaceae bacterium]